MHLEERQGIKKIHKKSEVISQFEILGWSEEENAGPVSPIQFRPIISILNKGCH